jgi:hypothetical protein
VRRLVEIKIDRVELTMGGSIYDAHIAEYWEPYVYGKQIPDPVSTYVTYETIREVERVDGEFFEREYYVRAWCKNMPFIPRAKVPVCFEDLLGYGLITTSNDRRTNYVVREIFGKLKIFTGDSFHDFSPQQQVPEDEFFRNVLTTVRLEHDSLMPGPRPQGNEAMWMLEELRNRYIYLRSALYWLGYDLAGFEDEKIEEYYNDMIARADGLRNMPELKKRRWFQNHLTELKYLFEEHVNQLLNTPENGYVTKIGYMPKVDVPQEIRKTSDEIVNKLNDMRLVLLGAGRRWVPDVFG